MVVHVTNKKAIYKRPMPVCMRPCDPVFESNELEAAQPVHGYYSYAHTFALYTAVFVRNKSGGFKFIFSGRLDRELAGEKAKLMVSYSISCRVCIIVRMYCIRK